MNERRLSAGVPFDFMNFGLNFSPHPEAVRLYQMMRMRMVRIPTKIFVKAARTIGIKKNTITFILLTLALSDPPKFVEDSFMEV